MTKILWHSNGPHTPTGYGTQTRLFVPELANHYDVAYSAFFGLEGAIQKRDKIRIFPGLGGGSVGNESLVPHANRFFDGDPRGGIVLTLMDVWVLDPGMAAQLNMACWVPVDHEPAPPAVIDFIVKSGAVPIAMSRFGERMLGRLDPLYVPHGVDTAVYKPHPRKEVRERVGLPEDAFLVGMVAANKGRPSRKGFSQAFQAFRQFREKHDNAVLYLHTTLDSSVGLGEDIPGLLAALDIPPNAVAKADQYQMLYEPYPDEAMSWIYSAMDVLLNPSMGEGFGIPILEAQACGTPAIVSNFSAMPEVCGAGWHVAVRPYWTGQNSWQCIPDVDDIVRALEQCYAMAPEKREALSLNARAHAMSYDVAVVMERHMLPALRAVEQRFANQQPVSIAPRLKAAA